MTPAVTAKALMRLARVAISTLARVGYATEEQADQAKEVPNRFHVRWQISSTQTASFEDFVGEWVGRRKGADFRRQQKGGGQNGRPTILAARFELDYKLFSYCGLVAQW